jgi:hypothetical protein
MISNHYYKMIGAKFLELCNIPSDINEHLPTLAKCASECTHVTECGVRAAVSSYAFASALLSKPNAKLVQVDPDWHPNIDVFRLACAQEGLQTVFHQQSDLECPMEETDMLFIDTWHVYAQLRRELERWHPHVRKYIVMHDTTVDEWQGETIRLGWNAEKQSRDSGFPVDEIRRGLWPAITDFLVEHRDWVIHKRYRNNNGLTILTRYTHSE